MNRFSEELNSRRKRNRKALASFGIKANVSEGEIMYRTIRTGKGVDIFTIGYERRDGEDLICALKDAGVDTLVDVREKPVSRKPDFRGKALKELCENSGIVYYAMPSLGSTGELRDRLRETGDFKQFRRRFASLANRKMQKPLEELARLATRRSIALLCYERCHEECHRSILADMLADSIDASVIAIP
ncbi:MAG: hypothetical protein Kow00105_02600 [Phycisphaeraceae bacterium]